MTGEIISGIYENGIIKPSKKLDITGKRDVLIIFKEKKKGYLVVMHKHINDNLL